MSAYSVVAVDLSTARAIPTQLVEPNKQVRSLSVLALPDGSDLTLQDGNGGDLIPLAAGMAIDWDCNEGISGLYLQNSAASGKAILFLSFLGGARVSMGV